MPGIFLGVQCKANLFFWVRNMKLCPPAPPGLSALLIVSSELHVAVGNSFDLTNVVCRYFI